MYHRSGFQEGGSGQMGIRERMVPTWADAATVQHRKKKAHKQKPHDALFITSCHEIGRRGRGGDGS